MKLFASLLALLVIVTGTTFAQKEGSLAGTAPYYLKNYSDSLGYYAGWTFGLQVKSEESGGPVLNYHILMAGAKDALQFTNARLTIGEVNQLVQTVRTKLEEIYRNNDTTINIPKVIYGTPTRNTPERIVTMNDSISYAIGYNYGYSVRSYDRNLTPLAVAEGLIDCLSGNESRLTEDDILDLELQRQREKMTRQNEVEMRAQREQAFLEENARRPGVQQLDGGIQYEILDEGEGETAGPEDQVSIHISASRMGDDHPYYDSRKTNQPLVYYLSETTDEWIPILTEMPVGARWRLWIPPFVAFGEGVEKRGVPEMLIFDVEMVGINDQE